MDGHEKILYLTFDFLEPIFSGNGTLSQIQIFGLLERGFHVMVICPDFGEINDTMQKWMDKGSLEILPIHIKSVKDLSPSCDWNGFFLQSHNSVNKIIEYNPNLIINPDWHTADVAIHLKKLLSIPLIGQFFRIFSFFKEYISNSKTYDLVKKKEQNLISNSDVIITLSSFDKEWCLKNGGKLVYTIYAPLTKDFMEILYKIPFKELKNDTVKLITISRIVPEKNMLRVFPLIHELEKMGVDFKYTIIGESLDKEYANKIRETIEIFNLHRRVNLIGRISLSEMVTLLRENEIYIHTSSYEPFGITIIEAAAAGCAVAIDQNGLIGAREHLEKIFELASIIPISYSSPKQSALALLNHIKERVQNQPARNEKKILAKLKPELYVDNLVKIFRDFL